MPPQSVIYTRIAWLLPAMYAVHLAEEYYAGITLPTWISTTFNADLSTTDFIWINAVAIGLILSNAIAFSLGKRNLIILLAIVVILTLNGFLHVASSLLWWEYVPGTISGMVLYIPLGLLAFKRISQTVTGNQRKYGIIAGILLHLVVFILAQTI